MCHDFTFPGLRFDLEASFIDLHDYEQTVYD